MTLNNKLDLHLLNIPEKLTEQLPSIERLAHRTEVRCLAFSSDDMLIASGSAESLKIWNRLVKFFISLTASYSNIYTFSSDIAVNLYELFLVITRFAVCSYLEIIWY